MLGIPPLEYLQETIRTRPTDQAELISPLTESALFEGGILSSCTEGLSDPLA